MTLAEKTAETFLSNHSFDQGWEGETRLELARLIQERQDIQLQEAIALIQQHKNDPCMMMDGWEWLRRWGFEI